MRNRKVTRVLAAVLTGAMLMTTPSVALAGNLYNAALYDANAAIPTVQGLTVVKEKGDCYLTWTPITLTNSQYLVIECSEDPTFPDNDKTWNSGWYDAEDLAENNNRCRITGEAGITRYYRVCVYDWNAETQNAYTKNYGSWSNIAEYTAEVPDVEIENSKVTSTSVYFRFNEYVEVTGYEISRKTGSGKYVKVATVADNVYTDKSLKSNQTYDYRIRAYVYNETTKTTTYGDYLYTSMTTWGNALKVNARATGTKTIKVSWKKVAGATGYKVYRQVGSTYGETKDGYSDSFSNYKLVKTIKKASTISFTDKNLSAGQTYTYKVVAYKNVKKNGKTTSVLSVDGYDSATLGLKFTGVKEIYNKDGSVTLKWDKIVGAEGYKIEQYGKKADGKWDYVEVNTLPGTTTSYTFPAATESDTWRPEYKMYVYKGSEIEYVYNGYEIETSSIKVATTSGITAEPTADLTGVTVSWAPVPGAAYYKVYRTRTLGSYNADRDTYNAAYDYDDSVKILKTAGTATTDALGTYYEWEKEPIYTTEIPATVTSIVDTYQGYPVKKNGEFNPRTGEYLPDTIVMEDIQDAPALGVRYYYYVRAYASNGKKIDEWGDEYEDISTGAFGKPASVVLNSVSLKKPTISKVTAGKAKATVSWKKVTGASKYYVYYSTKKNSGYTFAGITTKTKLSVTGLTSGKKYYFKVKACTANAAGADVFSALSAAKSKKVK